jgi:hypothetical protein
MPGEKLQFAQPPEPRLAAGLQLARGRGQVSAAAPPIFRAHGEDHGDADFLQDVEEVLQTGSTAKEGRLVQTVDHEHTRKGLILEEVVSHGGEHLPVEAPLLRIATGEERLCVDAAEQEELGRSRLLGEAGSRNVKDVPVLLEERTGDGRGFPKPNPPRRKVRTDGFPSRSRRARSATVALPESSFGPMRCWSAVSQEMRRGTMERGQSWREPLPPKPRKGCPGGPVRESGRTGRRRPRPEGPGSPRSGRAPPLRFPGRLRTRSRGRCGRRGCAGPGCRRGGRLRRRAGCAQSVPWPPGSAGRGARRALPKVPRTRWAGRRPVPSPLRRAPDPPARGWRSSRASSRSGGARARRMRLQTSRSKAGPPASTSSTWSWGSLRFPPQERAVPVFPQGTTWKNDSRDDRWGHPLMRHQLRGSC